MAVLIHAATPLNPEPDAAKAWSEVYECRPLTTPEEFDAWRELLSLCAGNPTDIVSHERLINMLFVRKVDA